MRKIVLIVLVPFLVLCGCSKKEEVPGGMETLLDEPVSVITAQTQQTISLEEAPAPEAVVAAALSSEFIKPTEKEIQSALKNAGYYTGTVDGNIGPKTKKAIEDFQAANGLSADGKVGPKTWALLSKHLNPEPVTAGPIKK
ncbi:MAG: peptidoglycan-binding domain-containing protein [Candidatus Omnitrophota bacterium]|nr:peptidoglycan-binding domain-containing protein [Candidatus Omnitrophota bacterium]